MPFAEQRVHQALDLGEFVPYFQPLVDLRVGSIHGFEILARWIHPDHGLVPPNKFIPLVERYGLINRLSVSLLTQAFASARTLPKNFGLSINLSPSQLHDRTLPSLIHRMADEAGFDLNEPASITGRSIRTPCDTVSPHIFSKPEPTCAPFRSCSAIETSRLAFSKKLENFEAAVGLHFAYYNFVKRHNTLKTTPAVAAGVTGATWSVGDLVEAAK
jgi:EAL domain